ncbi:phosphate signaling complex protein PhoU [uncultured Corynebacterium sp.]|uniref:phosphate signaling complex protein PhoU n=1 Tax=uncultured Corynebacterium sp. TaxID=159447 RepID=UPI0025E4CF97|nr:phosphate signaling complex protein PhoU [uncultured Corynebacterium sp.]
MRRVYRNQLREFKHDISLMADFVRTALNSATRSLLEANLELAEKVLSSVDTLEDLRLTAVKDAFQLLALEAPVARDLRVVVAGQHIVEDFTRMGALAVHVAKVARRRHPENAVPEPIRPYIEEMARQCDNSAAKIQDLLRELDVQNALKLIEDDDAVDDIHRHLFQLTTQREWPHSVREAVDLTLLSRYLERYSDHAVEIANRIVFIITGLTTDEYQRKQEDEELHRRFREQFDELRYRYDTNFDF